MLAGHIIDVYLPSMGGAGGGVQHIDRILLGQCCIAISGNLVFKFDCIYQYLIVLF